MSLEIMPLMTIAALAGIIHTLLGPDHIVPFIALAKAQSWSRKKTARVTSFCGLGHIASSVVIGYLAFSLRATLGALHIINSTRSDLAAWALIAFGCVYFIWSLKKLYKNKEQAQDHAGSKMLNPIFWGLFIIFVVGPCEPLFFLLTYPSIAHNPLIISLLVGVFGLATIATMVTVVLTVSFGLKFSLGKQTMRFAPAMAGIMIISCGLAMKFLGA